MRVHAINLDRDTGRWAQFEQRNGTLVDVLRVPAVDGTALDRKVLVDRGLIVEPLNRNDGAIGCALSHTGLWQHAVDTGETMTIVEDDTVLAPNFPIAAQRLLDRLPADWDLVMWGWNFDGSLWAQIPDGVSTCRLDFDQDLLRQNLQVFRSRNQEPTPVRLRHCAGTHAYTVTPAGAAAMLAACLPMTDRLISYNRAESVLANRHHDMDMSRAYPDIRAYACLPPLAVTENRHETSHTKGAPG